ncbi:MAG: hypothetical protein HRU78_01050 [Gammaproteobacteria bacterium]|nr:MAG: hypothetical protein HRU78_01050 [Gammaproteobacteria bacterium]
MKTKFSQTSTLTILPVLESETHATMSAGLGLSGFAARRKNQNTSCI